MFFKKNNEKYQKKIWMEKVKNKGVNIGKEVFRKNNLLMLLLIVFTLSTNQSFANISLPFQDTLDFGLGLTKTIGGTIVLAGLILAFIFHRGGREGLALQTGVWAFGVGVLIGNLDWIAEKLQITSGAVFI